MRKSSGSTATERRRSSPSDRAFAADADNVYWIEGQDGSRTAGVIMTMPKDGSAAPRTLVSAGRLVSGLVSSGPNLYWSEGHVTASVQKCVVANCAQTVTTIATARAYPHYLAVRGSGAAWFETPSGPIYDSNEGTLIHSQLDDVGNMLASFPTEAGPSSLAIDATHIYWTTCWETGALAESTAPGAVKRVRRPH